jgi:hypothetical protein
MCKYSIDPALEFVITLFRLEADWHFILCEILDKDHKSLHALAIDSMISK